MLVAEDSTTASRKVFSGCWIERRLATTGLVSFGRITAALTGPPPINIDFRNDAIGGSASNAWLYAVASFMNVNGIRRTDKA